MTVPLSVLDLASVYEGMSNADALAHTIDTARVADAEGFRRFWVAEHHGMDAVSSSAPAVLMSAIASATPRIRVGSGGVMLPNHSSLVIAEQFGTLVALFGDRIDLGLGRAPGTDGLTARVLRRNIQNETENDFPQQVLELLAFFGITAPLANGLGSTITAVPGLGDAPAMWLLGSSGYSAQLAGMLGLPFVFAHHFAGTDQTPQVFDLYRASFREGGVLETPYAMVSVATLVGADSADAERLALPNNLWTLRLFRGGRPGRVPTQAAAEAYDWTSTDRAFAETRNASQAVGDLDRVTARVDELCAATGADEVLLVPQGGSTDVKLATLRALGPVARAATARESVGSAAGAGRA